MTMFYRGFRYDVLTPEILEKCLKDILNFRTAFNLPVKNPLLFENEQLHADLFREEMRELFTAETRIDKIDAVVDTLYVMLGAWVEGGATIRDMFNFNSPQLNLMDTLLSAGQELSFDVIKAWDIVHSSNMSKLCDDSNINQTQEKYQKLGVETQFTLSELTDNSNSSSALYVVTVESDVTGTDGKFYPAGKVLKSIDYIPADLSEL